MTEVERAKSFKDTARDIARRIFRHENAALIAVLIGLIGGMSVITHGLTTSRINMMNILLQSSFLGMAATGQAFVILTAGIDVSVGGIGLFASTLGTSMMTGMAESNIVGHPVSIYIVVPIMLLVATGWGTINGLLVSRIGMPSLIVTLGMWEITKGLAFYICGGRSIFRLPDNLAFFGQGKVAGVPVPLIICVVVAVVAYFVLNHTAFGRSVYAIGGNPLSAWLSGIKVKKYKLWSLLFQGFWLGLLA